MSFNLNKIIGTDTVGQAFTKVNQNIDKQIVSGFTNSNNLVLVSRDGTQESIPFSSITGNFLNLSGGSLNEGASVLFKDSGAFKTFQISANTLDFYDDNVAAHLRIIPIIDQSIGDTEINIKQGNGYIPVVPNTTSNDGKFIIVSGDSWNYLTISGGPNVNVYKQNDVLFISGSASGGGISGTYVSGLTNISGGISVLSSITNNNLVNKPLTGAGGTIITETNGIITISSTTGGGGGISGTYVSGLTSAGTGNILLLSSITNNNLVYISISAGSNIGITDVNGTITISAATGGGSGTITSGTSLGGGSNIFSGVSSTNLVFRSLSGASGMQTAESGNLVLVRPATTTANRIYVGNAGATSMIQSPIIQLDHTSETIGINAAASTSTRLLFPAQSTGVSPLRFTSSSTLITAPVNGDVWYLTAGDTLQFRKNAITTDFIFKDNNISLSASTNLSRIVESSSAGTLTATRTLQPFGVFNALSSVIISSTTVETSCISTQLIGSTTLQASTGNTPAFVAGKKYRFTANGTIGTHSSAGNLTARLKLGSSVIASVSGFNLHNSISSPNNFFIEASFTVRTATSGGTVVGSGFLQTDHVSLRQNGQSIVGLNNLGEVIVDCTTDKIFDFTFQFSVANASNIITINEATLEYLN